MKFVTLSVSEFTKFASKHPNKSFFQTEQIAKIRQQNNWTPYYLGIKDKEEIVAATMLVGKTTFLKHKTFYAPGGPLIDYENAKLLHFFTENLKKFLKQEKGLVFHIDPYYELIERDRDGNIVKNGFNHEKAVKNLTNLGYKPLKISEQPKYLFALDLNNRSEKELLESFKTSTRNKINKTKKHGIKIHELKKSELSRFKKITTETSYRRGFQDKTLNYYQTMFDLFGDQVKFLIADIDLDEYRENLNNSFLSLNDDLNNIEKELKKLQNIKNPDNQQKKKIAKLKNSKKPIILSIEDIDKRLKNAEKIHKKSLDLSAAMFVLYGDEIIYLFSGSYEEYMKFDAQYLIQWYMIKYAAKNHFKRYNFYGIQGLPDPKQPDYGVYEFKKGFGGQVVELLGSYELPLSPIYYVHNTLSKLKAFLKHEK